jgi:nicotinate-nucleotide adenylyltransferase
MTSAVAVYGGSFDPPHLGHTLVCAYVLAACGIDRLVVVPVGQHPFSKRVSAFEDRLRMCELAFRDLRRLEVSSIEHELPSPSLTLHTLTALQARYPDAGLRLVIGSDLLPETQHWFEFERVRAIAPLIVVQREGHPSPGGLGPPLPDISSTLVRERLRASQATDGLLSPEVAAYARAHRLYA